MPAAVYPVEFVVCLLAPIRVGRRRVVDVAAPGRVSVAIAVKRDVTWARIGRDGLVLLGVIAAVVYWLYLTQTGGAPVDAHAFWAADPNDLYAHDELANRRLLLLAGVRVRDRLGDGCCRSRSSSRSGGRSCW